MHDKGIEITRHSQGNQGTISQHGVEIRHQGRPVSGELAGIKYVYLVADCSYSMEGDKLNQAKKGSLNFAKDAWAKGYFTGLIQFHSSPTHLCEPARKIGVLEQCLKQMEVGGETHMAKAIKLAHQKLRAKIGTRVMVIVTDGMPNGLGDPEASLRAGENARKDGIDIITIGTDDADLDFLRRLASRAELGIKVSKDQLGESITSAAKMLPRGK